MKRMNAFAALLILISGTLTGCSGGSTLRITMPKTNPKAKTSTAMTMAGAPSTFDGFNCFAINVTGPGISGPSCPTGSTVNSSGMGVFSGFVAPGQSVKVTVPSGPGRVIQLLGQMVPAGTACPSPTPGQAPPPGTNPAPTFLLGSATSDIFSDKTVTLQAAYDPSNPVPFMPCSGGGIGGFDPGTLPGLYAWYDASTLGALALNSSITTWYDKTLAHVDITQASPTYQPTFVMSTPLGGPAVRFAPGNYLTNGTPPIISSTTPNLSIFAVYNPSTTATGDTLIRMTYPSGYAGISNFSASSTGADGFANTPTQVSSQGGLVSMGSWTILSMTWDGTTVQMIQYGTYGTPASAVNNVVGALNSVSVGASPTGTMGLGGDIAEIIVYNAVRTSSEIAAIECYLNGKYGIGTLPHPCP
ncbi:MAG: hypothetical protein ACXWPM_05040 [Bdellovibrionota bacterium]